MKIEPGTIVLAALAEPNRPNEFRATGLLKVNGDGDLFSNTGFVARGAFVILGIARPL